MLPTTDLRLPPATDPTEIYRYRDGLYATDLLACALVFLDLFTWLDQRPSTIAELCRDLKIADRSTDVMVTLFVSMNLLERSGDHVQLTPMAREHLVRTSPFYIGPYYAALKDRPVTKDFLEVLRTDKPANWGSFKDERDWAQAMENETFAQNFTAAMDCRGVFLGQALSKKLNCARHTKLLDIAGGSGIYACALAAQHSHLSASVFEKTPVHKVAAAAIARRGYSGRVDVIQGDMFKDPLPKGYDLHLISNVLHDWNQATVEAILRSSHAALVPGGMVIIHDVHINEEKTGPYPNAAYSALLMHATEGKCYSLSELYPMLRSIGFDNFTFTPTAADRSFITATKK